jgi:acyl-CoA thioesterase FadM
VVSASRDFELPLRVRYGECDPQGIVFNANYLLYFDVVFTELWRAALGPWQELKDAGVDLVVANANIDFRASARFDDELVRCLARQRAARLRPAAPRLRQLDRLAQDRPARLD